MHLSVLVICSLGIAIAETESLNNESRILKQSQVYRLDQVSGTWLSTISTSATSPTAIAWDATHQFVLGSNGIYRSSSNGSNQALFLANDASFKDIFVSQNNLYVITTTNLITYDRFTGVKVADVYLDAELGAVKWKSTPAGSSISGAKANGNTATLYRINLEAAVPSLTKQTIPLSRTSTFDFWPNRSATRIWLSDGTLWKLGQSNALLDTGHVIDGATFYSLHQSAVLNGSQLQMVGPAGTATITLTTTPTEIVASDSNLYLLTTTTSKPTASILPWTQAATTGVMGEAPRRTLTATDRPLALTNNGHLLYQTSLTSGPGLLRWSLEEQDFLAPIAYPDSGEAVYHSGLNKLIYIPYSSSAIRRVQYATYGDLISWNSAPAVAGTLVPTKAAPTSDSIIIGVGSFETAELNLTNLTWSTSSMDLGYSNAWNEAEGKLFQYSNGTVSIHPRPFGNLFDTINVYHSRQGSQVSKLSPNGRRLVAGDGWLYNGPPWAGTEDLGVAFQDVAWKSNAELHSLRSQGTTKSLLEFRKGAKLRSTSSATLEGTPLKVFASPSETVVLTLKAGQILVHQFGGANANLLKANRPPLGSDAPEVTNRTTTSISLSFQSPADNGDSIRIDYRLTSSITWTTGQPLPPNTSTFTQAGLTKGKTYEFQAVTTRRDQSATSAPVTVATPSTTTLDGTPYDLVLTGARDNQLKMSWKDRSTMETGFIISRSLSSTGSSAIVVSLAANTTSYTDVTVSSNTTYYYSVKAVNSSGTGVASPFVKMVTSPAGTLPSASVTTTAARSGIMGNKITWVAANPGETDGYLIERKITFYDIWVEIARVPATDESYIDTSVQAGITYSYRVRTFNHNGPLPANAASESLGRTIPAAGSDGNDAPVTLNGITYFVDTVNDLLLRYDQGSQTWMPSIFLALDESAHHWSITSSGIFIATRTTIFKITTDTGTAESIYEGTKIISEIWAHSGRVYAAFNDSTPYVLSIPATGGTPVKSNLTYAPKFSAKLENSTTVFNGFHNVVSIVGGLGITSSSTVNPIGYQYSTNMETPVTQAWALPDGNRFLDNNGNIYYGNGTSAGQLGYKVDALAVNARGEIVLASANMLYSFDSDFQFLRSVILYEAPYALAFNGTNIICFVRPTSQAPLNIQSVPESSMGLPSTADQIRSISDKQTLFTARDGSLWVYDSSNSLLLRWSWQTNAFDKVVRIKMQDALSCFSQSTNAFYVAFAGSAVIRKYDLDNPSAAPTNIPINAGLVLLDMADGQFFLRSSTKAWLMDDQRNTKSFTRWVSSDEIPAERPFWDKQNQIYFRYNYAYQMDQYSFGEGSSPIGENLAKAFNTIYLNTLTKEIYPSASDGRVLSNNGALATYPEGKLLEILPVMNVLDAVWIQSSLYVLSNALGNGFEITRWTSEGHALGSIELRSCPSLNE